MFLFQLEILLELKMISYQSEEGDKRKIASLTMNEAYQQMGTALLKIESWPCIS